MLHHFVVFLEIFCGFDQLCWAKTHYSTYNFLELTFCIYFSFTHYFKYKNCKGVFIGT